MESLAVDASTMVWLDSYRINNYINASLHYLVLGSLAEHVAACHAEMVRSWKSGDPTWFERARGARYFERQGTELRLNYPHYFAPTSSIIDADLHLVFSARNGSRRVRIPLDHPRWDFFTRLLPRLCRYIPMDEVRAAVSEGEWAFVQQMVEARFLRVGPSTSLRQKRAHTVRLIAHSCVLFESEGTRVLVDPLLVVRYRPDYNSLSVLDAPLDAVVLSHPHWDHFNLDSLIHLPRQTLLLLPCRANRASIVNPDMTAILQEMGFINLIELEPWQEMRVGGISIRATPFFGEGSGPESPQDWMTYLVRIGGRNIFGAVDSCHDHFGSMDDVLGRVRASFGPVDVLLAPVSGFYYPTSVFTRRPFHLGPGIEQFSGTPEDVVRWTALCGASITVPYAMFHYDGEDVAANVATRYSTGTIQDLRSRIQRYPEGPLCVLRPGGSLSWREDGPVSVRGAV